MPNDLCFIMVLNEFADSIDSLTIFMRNNLIDEMINQIIYIVFILQIVVIIH